MERALDQLLLHALLPLDVARARLLEVFGPLGRTLLRKRAARVALSGALVCTCSFVASACLPLALLTLGPLLLGVPHLVSDIRYLVVRQRMHERRTFWLMVAPCLVLAIVQPRVAWGTCAVALAALAANGKMVRRVLVAGLALALGFFAHRLARRGDLLFTYGHNLVALAAWAVWAREQKRHVLVVLALYLLATVAIFSGAAESVLFRFGSLAEGPLSLEAGPLVSALSPVRDPRWGLRWLMFFAFSQSVHYGVWLRIVPDEDRARPGIRSFAASYRSLAAELGRTLVLIALLLMLTFLSIACFDLASARDGYMRLALFHGPLELTVFVHLWLSRQPLARALS